MGELDYVLTVLWDGRPIGRVRVTERRFRPEGEYTAPAAWEVEGDFTPEPAFADCRAAFEERDRREQVYDEAPCGPELAAACEAMRRSIRAILDHVSVRELAGRVFDFIVDLEEGRAYLRYPPGAVPDAGR
jgi:hypothetical protein